MGKREKKQKHQRNHRRGAFNYCQDEEDCSSPYPLTQPYSSSSSPPRVSLSDEEKKHEEEEDDDNDDNNGEKEAVNEETSSDDMPSKFLLYQQSVQFFLMYVGGRRPLHLQEDFCGTALISTEWLRSDSRRTAVGLDLDLETLQWCIERNIPKVGADGFFRLSLFLGNVLQPLHQSKLVISNPQELISNVTLADNSKSLETGILEAESQSGSADQDYNFIIRNVSLPARDIVCAFNYSCCCLHKRADLVLYFRQAHSVLKTKGGIFVMDLYGGTSPEHKLRLQRRFPNFTYVWEQADFDIIERKTRISLHVYLKKQQRKIRHAFSYSWRLWTLPEIRECLEEADFGRFTFGFDKCQLPPSSQKQRDLGWGGT